MLFAVIVEEPPANDHEGLATYRAERLAVLQSLCARGVLLLEATLGEGGSLMVIEAASTNDVLEILHRDPVIVLPVSNRVSIRPVALNVIGDLGAARGAKSR